MRSIMVLMLAFMIAISSSAVHASDTGEKKPQRVKTEQLVPEKNSDILESLTVTTFDDGSKLIEGSITESNKDEIQVIYSVDTNKNTYRANIEYKDDLTTPSVGIGTKSVQAAVVTYDPVLLEVARHFSKLTWTVGFVAGANVITGFSSQHSCTPANPTMILNTHWFTSQCDKSDVLSSAKTQVSSAVTARFWNTDFHDINLRTDVTSWSRITGHTDFKYTVNWWQSKTGENSSLLSGELFVKAN